MLEYKILIVENDKDFSFILQKWISSTLYNLTIVNNAEDAQKVIANKQWDLVISDVNLPGLSGLGLLDSLNSNGKNCPVILMTGHATLEMAVEAVEKNAEVFLMKPFTKEIILKKIDAAINLKTKIKKRKILAIGAHPDDVEIGCGGILLKHAQAGDELHILTMSFGGEGGNSIVRYNEAKKAALDIGADLHIANLKDTEIPEGSESIKVIEEVVKRIQPDIVYTHSLNDSHQDHRNVHQASLVACRNVESLECYQSPSSTTEFQPTRFVDVTFELSKKINLIKNYRSQTKKCIYLKDSIIESTARYWGRFANYKMVEPLEVIRSV